MFPCKWSQISEPLFPFGQNQTPTGGSRKTLSCESDSNRENFKCESGWTFVFTCAVLY